MKKFNFKKVSAVLGSVFLTGLTLGTAAAASYPAPFVSGNSADVAIVYGSNAASSDMTQAAEISTDLGTYLSSGGGSISVSGGESFMLDKAANNDGSDSFNLGDALNTLYTSIDDADMDFLADGTYDDGDIDEDYEQEIVFGGETLRLFADNDYNDDEPTIGFLWNNGDHILNYTFELDDSIADVSDFEDTEIPMLGGNYYVLSATATTLELLDTAEKSVVELGETVTVNGKDVEITYIDDNSIQFTVDGEPTDSLSENEEHELDDGSYIVPTNIQFQDVQGIQRAEFSIGSGKITVANGDEVEINDEDVDNLIGHWTGNQTITFEWNADGDELGQDNPDVFLGEGESIMMPGLGVISLAYGGIDFPSPETITVANGDTLSIEMDNYDLPLMWYDSTTDAAFGKDGNLLNVEAEAWNSTGLGTQGGDLDLAAGDQTGLNLTLNDRFIVTSIGTDLGDVETLYYEVDKVEDDSGDIIVELTSISGSDGGDLTFDALEENNVGDVTVDLVDVYNESSSTGGQIFLNFSSDETIYFNRVVSDSGLVANWTTTATDATDGTGFTLTFFEQDKDLDLAEGSSFSATVANTSNDELHVSTQSESLEEESDDFDIGYIESALASKIMFDTGADENEYSIEYYGEEVTADVQVVAGGEVSTDSSGDGIGDVLITDQEVDNFSDTNLIVVGGSCINSAAATLVGGDYCGSAFTDATGVGSGQFLIKSYSGSETNGLTSKMALLVAGYEASDTANAATFLTNEEDVDTSGEYIGTSSTSATLQTA